MKIPGINGLKDDIMAGRYFLRDIHPDKKGNEWRNTSYANYFGFDFSLRVKKPYLIFLPELLSNSNWKIHKSKQNMMVLSRMENYGFQHFRALYLISPKNACVHSFTIQSNHEKNEKKGKKSIQEVAIVNSVGNIDFSYCVSRLELDPKLLNVSIKPSRFSTMNIDFDSTVQITQLPDYMQVHVKPVKKWQACHLPKNSNTISEAFFCTVSNGPKMKKGILTYGPYHPISPGQYRATIQYLSEGNAGTWDQVVQFNKGAQYIIQQPLPDTQGKINILNYDFNVLRANGKLEIRSYYNGVGTLKVFSVQLNALK